MPFKTAEAALSVLGRTSDVMGRPEEMTWFVYGSEALELPRLREWTVLGCCTQPWAPRGGDLSGKLAGCGWTMCHEWVFTYFTLWVVGWFWLALTERVL
jgi:hypothetical protein